MNRENNPLSTFRGKLIEYVSAKDEVNLYYDDARVELRASIFLEPVDKKSTPLYTCDLDFEMIGDYSYLDLSDVANKIKQMRRGQK